MIVPKMTLKVISTSGEGSSYRLWSRIERNGLVLDASSDRHGRAGMRLAPERAFKHWNIASIV
jgi:hypothetical protein